MSVVLTVIFTSGDATPMVTTICDQPLHALENFKINGQHIFDTRSLWRAMDPLILDRFTSINGVSFGITRGTDSFGAKYAGAGPAMIWGMDHVTEAARKGSVEFRVSEEGFSASRWMANAALPVIALGKYMGKALVMEYTLVGGRFLKAAP